VFVADRSYKLISTTRDGFNKGWLLVTVPQNLANPKNVLFDHFGIYEGVGPYCFQDLILGYQASWMLNEIPEYVERLRRDGDPLALTP